ncbi:MAG TPA: F0F1 ATP synthase subunit B [Aliidongia sp.]|nr:F0F1 ATP synthase subunit B [Aliidongia sp.]
MELLRDPEFWVFVAFVIAIVLMVWKGGGQVTSILDNRAQRIRTQLDEARRLREEAEAALAEYQRKQRDAMTEAQEIVKHAEAEAERVAQQAVIDLENAIKRREEQARDKIAQAEIRALAEVRAAAVDVAIDAVRVVLQESIDATRGAALIDQVIHELPQRLH